MATRNCAECGRQLGRFKRRDALYCDKQCKKMAYAKRKVVAEVSSDPPAVSAATAEPKKTNFDFIQMVHYRKTLEEELIPALLTGSEMVFGEAVGSAKEFFRSGLVVDGKAIPMVNAIARVDFLVTQVLEDRGIFARLREDRQLGYDAGYADAKNDVWLEAYKAGRLEGWQAGTDACRELQVVGGTEGTSTESSSAIGTAPGTTFENMRDDFHRGKWRRACSYRMTSSQQEQRSDAGCGPDASARGVYAHTGVCTSRHYHRVEAGLPLV